MDSLCILVAEDDPDDAFLLRRAFVKAGLNAPVQFVRSGDQVVDYLQGNPPFEDKTLNPKATLLLLDLRMPGFDGFDVLKWLRLQSHLRDLVVIVFSGSDRPQDVAEAHQLGAVQYLVKPQDPRQLAQMARSLLQFWNERGHFALSPFTIAQAKSIPPPGTRLMALL